MASIKPQIRNQVKQSGLTNIKIRISHRKYGERSKTRYISTNFDIDPRYFDNVRAVVKKQHPNAKYLNIELRKLVNDYEVRLMELGEKIDFLSANDIVEYLKNNNKKSFVFFFREDIENTTTPNRKRIKIRALNLIIDFCKSENISFDEIDSSFMDRFNRHMEQKYNVNSRRVVLAELRMAMNKANREGLIKNTDYQSYTLPKRQIKHRALTYDELIAIRDMETNVKNENIARDIFFLSFYLAGINYNDLYKLQKNQLKKKRLNFTRSKTLQPFNILVHDLALEIIDKYKGSGEYLLQFAEQYRSIDSFVAVQNHYLKKIAKDLEINPFLSTYYARHTFATIGRNELNLDKDIIAKLLGHSDNSMTDLYIDFDKRKLDNALFEIIEYVSG